MGMRLDWIRSKPSHSAIIIILLLTSLTKPKIDPAAPFWLPEPCMAGRGGISNHLVTSITVTFRSAFKYWQWIWRQCEAFLLYLLPGDGSNHSGTFYHGLWMELLTMVCGWNSLPWPVDGTPYHGLWVELFTMVCGWNSLPRSVGGTPYHGL